MPDPIPRPPTGAEARATLASGEALLADGAWVAATADAARRAVIDAHRTLAEPQVRARLGEIAVERLRESTARRLRLAGVPEAGFATVLDVLDAPPSRLEAIPGIGQQTALALRGAAMQTLDQEGLRRDTLVAQQAFDGGGRRRHGCRCRIHEAAGRRSRLRE